MSETAEKVIVPTVGMGVTECIGSDRYAGTITRVSKSGKAFWFKHDNAKLVSGSIMSESQVYEYTPNENAVEHCAKLSRRHRDKGLNRFHRDSIPVLLDFRREYRDPSF